MMVNYGLKLFFALLVYLFPFMAHAYVDKDIAVVSILNKAAGKVQTVNIPVNQSTEFEKLSVIIKTCKQTDPFQVENFYAFAEIYNSKGEKLYSNWLDHNEPGKKPFQNPDYDLWLVECK